MRQLLLLLSLLIAYQSQAGDGFITTWQTTAWNEPDNRTIEIPTNPQFSYDYTVDWGDGNQDTNVTGNINHVYADTGTYTVEITGIFPAMYSANLTFEDGIQLLSIDQWGTIQWKSMHHAFAGHREMQYRATDVPDLSQVTDLSNMFTGATKFNGAIGNWDVSTITNFSGMFWGTRQFNQPVGNWDVSNGTDFSRMFLSANQFNQPVNDWNVSSGINFSYMFGYATSFNQPVGNWDVSNGINFSVMFGGGSDFGFNRQFNQDLSNWDVSKGTNFSRMFMSALVFNQDLSKWNVSNGTNFSEMFRQTVDFDQDLSSWDVSNGTNFHGMFQYTGFNQDISTWDVSNGTNFRAMFSNASFNQDIGNWDVSNGIYFGYMFSYHSSFNQDISRWDVSNGIEFSGMFGFARAFNQDISSWDVSKGTDFRSMFWQSIFDHNLGDWNIGQATNLNRMFEGGQMSMDSYDSTLIGWAQQPVQTGVIMGGTNVHYCLSEEARYTLIREYGWEITDAGRKCDFNIQGVVFRDVSEDGIYDGVRGLIDQKVMLLPDSIITFTDHSGRFNFEVPEGQYEILVLPSQNLEPSIGPSSYQVKMPENNGQLYTFGLVTSRTFFNLSSYLTAAPTQCGNIVPFWLSLQNESTVHTDAKIKLIPDPSVTLVSEHFIGYTFNKSGDTLIWRYSHMNPKQLESIQLAFQLPDADIGHHPTQELTFIYIVEGIKDNATAFSAIDTFTSTLQCDLVSNDKTVTPIGIGPDRFVSKDQYLTYRVRFQNTSNITAYQVMIHDTLQTDLDLNTFEVIGSSHAMHTQLNMQNGAVTFRFDNIDLPNAASDAPNSHGFVTYRVKAKTDSPEPTTVRNTAFIRFNFSEATVTNTTLTTLVNDLSQITALNLEDISESVTIFPNPNSSDQLLVRFANNLSGDAQLVITDVTGKVIRTRGIRNLQANQELTLDIATLDQGMYLIQLIQKDKRAVKKLVRQ